ncbi:hypothetical protein K504DRAFT_376760 [Pleomassaria siparia CBS 279.74]|uniref:5-Methylcytosine G/T mismatch-specific DNA glycosylase n=1 Tax=Pleomassaria siparia CBS 279.74 TaxID=1314801 RepID=A0A6G1KBQ0_9PLEO|nr:hypothetical protein K504DRAFT_376760 [Pleomassaria siparia CBS 279.74]
MAIVPEMDRRGSLGSPNGSRTSLGAYPTFSKTHSKDDPYSRSELAARNKSAFTPEPTDVSDRPAKEEKESVIHASPPAPTRAPPTPPPARAPPSPPLTATTANDLRKTASANSIRRAEALQKEMEAGRRSVDSGTRLTPEPRFAGARSSVHENATGMEGTELTSTTEGSEPSTVRGKSPARVVQSTVRLASPANAPSPARAASSNARPASRQASRVTQSTASDATSVAPTQQNARRHLAPSPSHSEASPASAMDSSPRTPTQHSVVYDQKAGSPMIEIMTDPISRAQSAYTDVTDVTDVTDTTDYTNDAPMTPPPPPPPPMMMEPPRVDYLLQNGGLSRPVPRSLLAAIDGGPIAAYNQYTSPRVSGAQEHDVRAFFTPLQKLLDDYTTVMDTNGSLAVATGYRSVARRLLDRLEAVFARNISSEFCHCIMCADNPVNQVNEDDAGVNWGEILELVSGRCDLPAWPPFDQSTSSGLGISDLEAPCQRIDVDVPEQYREHYQQQSRKTKVAVQSWLSNQHDVAPEDADEETLTFAMLTRLEQPKRPLFYALLYGLDELPNPRTKPDTSASTPPLISKAAVALQRLYRLYSPPRNQLVVMYLIRNPDKHNILATLSAVTKQEWEILVSGRFDGFLWSGAEDHNGISSPPPGGFSRGPSRGPSGQMFPDGGFQRFATPTVPGQHTPFSTGPSPGPGMRPGSVRPPGPAPVQIDEDTEIAVLAEIEREIFLGMEAMEDAFEHLHNSAEVIRRRLRERGAALAMVAQARRGPMGGIEVRMNTPAGYRVDQDGDNLEELRSEIGPDDSASNVSYNRRGRGHRSKARRTPAPVEEEPEEGSSLAERVRRRY